jgi:hypothetical protein
MREPSNYPPGVTGCEPEINGYDDHCNAFETIDADARKHRMTADDVEQVWRVGLTAYQSYNAWFFGKSNTPEVNP